MTNATKSLIVIFAVLLVIALLTSRFGGHTASESFRGNILEFSSAQVDRVEIDNPNRDYTIILERSGNDWIIENKDGSKTYAASKSVIESALNDLQTMQPSAVVARSIERHARYQVDDTGTVVRLFGNGQTLGSVVVGRFNFQSQTEFYTYVRPSHSDNVYSVPAFLNATVARDIPGWRDKTIWNLDASEITKVDFIYPADSSFTVNYAGNNIWLSDQDTLNSSLTNAMISQIAEFSADNFPSEDISASEFSNELYVINIEHNNQSRRIRIRPAENMDNRLEAVADEFPYLFYLNKNSFKNTVLRAKSEF